MYLAGLRIRNFKSFYDSGALVFAPGVNIIIGPNNSGKTALLQALSLRINNVPHRSQRTVPKRNDLLTDMTSVIEFTAHEDPAAWRSEYPPVRIVPTPRSGNVQHAIDALNESLQSGIDVQGSVTNSGLSPHADHGLYPSLDIGTNNSFLRAALDPNDRLFKAFTSSMWESNVQKSVAWEMLQRVMNRIYRFEAERMALSHCALQTDSSLLRPDASNLAAVLQKWQTDNPSQYRKFNSYVSDVIPSVKWVGASSNESANQIEIKVWPIPIETERNDLAVSIVDAGTGIGQVLAILCVAFTNDPKIVIIDEPQSFLHPGATYKLLQILQSFEHHQYFISTHSPEVLSASMPCTITQMRYEDGVSTASAIDLKNTIELREVLTEVGVKFGDIFFADNILWVEGPTEAESFPLMLKSEALDLAAVSVLPLVNTGDLRSKKHSKKHAKLDFEIYGKLSGAHSLAPPVIGVILDREATSVQEMKELKKLSNGLLEFLPRRLFENYLLNAGGIAAVMNSEENFSPELITPEKISAWIAGKRASGHYLDSSSTAESITDTAWLEHVDGARLLEDLFSYFSKTVEFRKTKHSVLLTSWLLEHAPDELLELRTFLRAVVTRSLPAPVAV